MYIHLHVCIAPTIIDHTNNVNTSKKINVLKLRNVMNYYHSTLKQLFLITHLLSYMWEHRTGVTIVGWFNLICTKFDTFLLLHYIVIVKIAIS